MRFVLVVLAAMNAVSTVAVAAPLTYEEFRSKAQSGDCYAMTQDGKRVLCVGWAKSKTEKGHETLLFTLKGTAAAVKGKRVLLTRGFLDLALSPKSIFFRPEEAAKFDAEAKQAWDKVKDLKLDTLDMLPLKLEKPTAKTRKGHSSFAIGSQKGIVTGVVGKRGGSLRAMLRLATKRRSKKLVIAARAGKVVFEAAYGHDPSRSFIVLSSHTIKANIGSRLSVIRLPASADRYPRGDVPQEPATAPPSKPAQIASSKTPVEACDRPHTDRRFWGSRAGRKCLDLALERSNAILGANTPKTPEQEALPQGALEYLKRTYAKEGMTFVSVARPNFGRVNPNQSWHRVPCFPGKKVAYVAAMSFEPKDLVFKVSLGKDYFPRDGALRRDDGFGKPIWTAASSADFPADIESPSGGPLSTCVDVYLYDGANIRRPVYLLIFTF